MLNVTVTRAALHNALALFKPVISPRNTIPILACVRLETETDGALSIYGTDLDLYQALRLETEEAPGRGAVCVPYAALADIVRKLDKGARVRLEHAEGAGARDDKAGRLLVHAGRAQSAILAYSVQDMPAPPAPVPDGDSCAVALAPFAAGLERVHAAASSEEIRYYLKGVCLEPDESGNARATATNGHNLLSDCLPDTGGLCAMLQAVPAFHDMRPQVILPTFAIKQLGKLAGAFGDSGAVIRFAGLQASAPRAFVHLETPAGRVRLAFRSIDGTFPDWRRVVPGAPGAMAGHWSQSSAADLLAFVDACGGKAKKPAAVAYRFAEGLDVDSSQTEAGRTANRPAPGSYTGESLDVPFSPAVLRIAAAFYGAAPCALHLDPSEGKQGRAAVMLSPVDYPDARAVVMPMIGVDYVAPAPVQAAPLEPAFPGMAASLFDVTADCTNKQGGARPANAEEIRAYLMDLCTRAGFRWQDCEGVTRACNFASASGLSRSFLIGEETEGPNYGEGGAVVTPAQFTDGAFSLLIPGGRRADAVQVETQDESGAWTSAGEYAPDRKGALGLSAADCVRLSGLEPVKARKARRTGIAAPVRVQAPAAPESIDAPAVQAEETQADRHARLVAADSACVAQGNVPHGLDPATVAGLVAHGETMRAAAAAFDAEYMGGPGDGPAGGAAVDPAPVPNGPAPVQAEETPAPDYRADYVAPILEPKPAGPSAAPVPVDLEPVQAAPVPVQADSDLAARLERLERLLGVAAPVQAPKRTASQAAAVRRAWSMRKAARAARKEAADWQAIAEANAAHVDKARAEAATLGERVRRLETVASEAQARAAAEYAGERADLVARLQAATEAADINGRDAQALARRRTALLCAKRQLVRRAATYRLERDRARVQAAGVAANLQAMTARAASDADRIRALEAIAGDKAPAGRPSFIMSSR